MQSAMLQSGAAGQSLHTGNGSQSLGPSLAFPAVDTSPAQFGDKAMGSSFASNAGWTLNGCNQHYLDAGRNGQQQQQSEQQSQSYQSSQQQQLEFPSNRQQQIHPTQAQLDAQMAQLHSTFAQFQQRPAEQLTSAAGCSTGIGPFGRLSTDGYWFDSSANSQLKQQIPHQQLSQQCGAVSALRQGLLLQQQVDRSPLGEVLQDNQVQKHTSTVSAPQAVHAAAVPPSAACISSVTNNQTHGTSTSGAPHASGSPSTDPAASAPYSSGRTRTILPCGPPSSNLTVRLTVQLVATYAKCAPAGAGSAQASGIVSPSLPRRVLTKPGAGVKNDGWDNESSDLVLCTQVSVMLHSSCVKSAQCNGRVV